MKYSTPDHSCIQEIDNVHSSIEKVLSKAEYYSPVSLLPLLRKVSTQKPYKILSMAPADFFDLKSCSSFYNYKVIPFVKVNALEFSSKNIFNLKYKLSHSLESEWITAEIRNHVAIRIPYSQKMRTPKYKDKSGGLTNEKIKAIKSMIKWMPKLDQDYFNTIIN
ncbi:hypothetical protein ABEB36_008109 [Hypothenemus hampei]|uniref:Uncharacterized protein n=1 Tax=Hypothenemus hampei TaxID=57062 RepID=A0ABD1EKT1_HYPHA